MRSLNGSAVAGGSCQSFPRIAPQSPLISLSAAQGTGWSILDAGYTPKLVRIARLFTVYEAVTEQVLVKPARSEAIPVPAEYQAFTSSKLVREPALQWRPLLCDQNMTDANIVAMQRELKEGGYYAQSLPTGNNFIAVDVAKELGISL